jgi:AcrR family transcriptional regulator
VTNTEERILDAATEVLGGDPNAGMDAVATAAGVVRRTVYGYFPSRSDLVLALTRRAAGEIEGVLASVDDGGPADATWVAFLDQVWPLVRRYRVLVVLRRGPFGPDIHALLAPVDRTLAQLVERGQDAGQFGRHLPSAVLAQVAWSALFTIADHDLTLDGLDARAATTSSLLLLGVPADRASAILADAS